MDYTLRQLPLTTDNDVLLAHELAMILAAKCSLKSLEQLSFASRVSQHSSLVYQKDETLTFSIHQLDDRIILRAATQKAGGRILVEVPALIEEGSADTPINKQEECTGIREEEYLSMQQFTMALSHELKNSIAKIKLGISLVQLEEMPPRVKDYVQVIERASNRLEGTMRSLNDIIRLGHSQEVIKAISPAAVFREVKEDFAELVEAKKAAINSNLESVATIKYAEIYLQSIFNNVISNALKYASPDRPLQLDIAAHKENGFIVFTFKDNGQGMDLTNSKKRLFEPFSRFNTDTEGSGLGLYMLKNMVERNGGKIEVTSEPQKGTTFYFFLKEY
jgi:signal transduction histidine kinase